ncbi:MAG: SigE family RNA polymerase sigma factor [Acidimicrobiales bacterium]
MNTQRGPIAEGPHNFTAGFDRYYRLAYRAAFGILRQPQDSEDAAMESLARAVVRWKTIEKEPEPWITGVAVNLAIDTVRRRRPPLAHDTKDSPSIEERLDLIKAIQRLPRQQRNVIVLRYFSDMSEAEIATALGCSVGTVKRHMFRAMEKLRTLLPTTAVQERTEMTNEHDAIGPAADDGSLTARLNTGAQNGVATITIQCNGNPSANWTVTVTVNGVYNDASTNTANK